MIKKIMFETVLLLILIPLVYGDGMPSYSFEVQGAKMVSEGGYFWFDVVNTQNAGEFQLVFPSAFKFVSSSFEDKVGNQTAQVADSGFMQVDFFLFAGEKISLLFIAPIISENYTTYTFQFKKIAQGSSWSESLSFATEVWSLKMLFKLDPEYFHLEKDRMFWEARAKKIEEITGFNWSRYCDEAGLYNFTKDFLAAHNDQTTFVSKVFGIGLGAWIGAVSVVVIAEIWRVKKKRQNAQKKG